MQLVDVCKLIIDCEHKTAPTQETGFSRQKASRMAGCGQGQRRKSSFKAR
jgi:hypothetical protein